MRLSDFNYNLPPELIAQHPLPNRTASRLLVLENYVTDVVIKDQQFIVFKIEKFCSKVSNHTQLILHFISLYR